MIDGTNIDSNMHSLRHNYFNLNPVLIQDLRQLITTRKSASERKNTLVRSHDNIFTYLCSPSIVTNK